jgi:hypothetical protein
MRPGAQACHQIGKWHCGMSIDAHLPINRGFASSFGYLAGAEDHFKDTRGDFVDLWRSASPAFGENGTVGELTYNTYKFTKEALSIIDNHPPMQVRQRYNLSTFYTTQTWSFCQDRLGTNTGKALKKEYRFLLQPLFLYLAFQNVHGPNEAPENYTALYDPEKVRMRKRHLISAMPFYRTNDHFTKTGSGQT